MCECEKALFSSVKWLFPFVSGLHAMLVVADFGKRQLQFYDSFHSRRDGVIQVSVFLIVFHVVAT